MIQFQNGEIYEGGWNSNNQRHGFGISINKEGTLIDHKKDQMKRVY